MHQPSDKGWIAPSELILNEDGSIYHLHLLPEQIADTIFTVGDPDRVEKVSCYFDRIDFRVKKREFITHGGVLNGKKVMVISTGMGTDNIEILMTELDALVNVDLQNRVLKKEIRSLSIIRLGTSGSLKKEIPLDSLAYSAKAIGLDTLMSFYEYGHSQEEEVLAGEIKEYMGLPFTPYITSSSLNAKDDFLESNTLTCPGFYAPQGRMIRLNLRNPLMMKKVFDFQSAHLPLGFGNFEMETAGYYAMARLLGHRCISFNAIVANRATGAFSSHAEKTIEKLIKKVLESV